MKALWALHYKGELVNADKWAVIADQRGFTRKTRVFVTEWAAKTALRHILPQYRDDVIVVRYEPAVMAGK
jgi:hypothetical protein